MKSNCLLSFVKGVLYLSLWLFDLFLLYVSGDTIHNYISYGGPTSFIVQESFVLFMASIALPAMCFITVIPTFLNCFCFILHVIVLIIRVTTIGFIQDDYGVYPEEKTDYYVESIFILVNTGIWLILVLINIVYPQLCKQPRQYQDEGQSSCNQLLSVISERLKSRSQQSKKASRQQDTISVTTSLPSYISEELPDYTRDSDEILPRYASQDRSELLTTQTL